MPKQMSGLSAAVYARWCGPAALAAATDITREQAAQLLADIRIKNGAKVTRTTQASTLSQCLTGWKVTHVPTFEYQTGYGGKLRTHRRPTLAHFCRELVAGGTYIVLVTGHFVVVRDGEVIEDNGVSSNRKRVRCIIHVDDKGVRRVQKAVAALREA